MKRIVMGSVLVGIGILLVLERTMGINFGLSFWSVVLTLLGGAMVLRTLRKGRPSWPVLALGLYIGGIGLFDILHAAEVTGTTGHDIATSGWPLLLIALGISFMFDRRGSFRWSYKMNMDNFGGPVGEFRYGRTEWLLDKDFSVDQGIGDVRIDLTTADITEGIHHVNVRQWVGETLIRVPEGVNVSVEGQVNVGDLEVLDDRRSGLGLTLNKKVVAPDSNVELRIHAKLGIGKLRITQGTAQRMSFHR